MLKKLLRFLTTSQNNHLDPARIAPSKSLVGLMFSIAAIGTFSVLFDKVRKGRTNDIDAAITHKVQVEGKRHRPFDRVMHIVSWPGFPPQSRTLPPLLAVLLWIRGFRLEALFQLAAWGTGGVSSVFKRIVQRQRPGPQHPHLTVVPANIGGTSFPSGHVIIYTGVYGFLAYLATLWIETKSVRVVVVAILTGLVSLVGISRVYLGHHWFFDTMASYLLGTTYLVALTSVYRRVKRWSLSK